MRAEHGEDEWKSMAGLGEQMQGETEQIIANHDSDLSAR